jgi:hypothetical protein
VADNSDPKLDAIHAAIQANGHPDVTAFIVKVCRAEAWLRQLTVEELAALPDSATAAMTLLQEALKDLGGHLPTKAEVLARKDPETEETG